MEVNVGVFLGSVLMVVGVNPLGKSFSEPPYADGDEHQTDRSLAPCRKNLEIQKTAEQEYHGADDRDTHGMAKSPQNPDQRGSLTVGESKGSNRSQMIRTGEGMHGAGSQAGWNHGE
jgi:hypothetical protein